MRGLEYLNEDDVPRGNRKSVSNKTQTKKSNHKHNYVVVRETPMEFVKVITIVTSECSICNKKRTETKHS